MVNYVIFREALRIEQLTRLEEAKTGLPEVGRPALTRVRIVLAAWAACSPADVRAAQSGETVRAAQFTTRLRHI